MGVRKLFRNTIMRLLAIEDLTPPEEQLKALNDLIAKYDIKITSQSSRRILQDLKRRHLVDSIIVSDNNGNLLLSTETNGLKDAIIASSVFQYATTEFRRSNFFFLKDNKGWVMFFTHNKRLFIVRAQSNLEPVELKALAKDVEKYLLQN
ncbi:MAG: hypothetical protein J7L14_01105 [Candidatus Diapherotrites archaeon]|nr:hypothetical protein [Candidatus Diapherotrites archaeon]